MVNPNAKLNIIHQTNIMAENSVKIRPLLVALEVGEEITFDVAKLKSVRTQASELGVILGRQYKTRTDRENRVITVQRIS